MNEFMQTALLAKDPVEWLAYKMTEPLEPPPKTIAEAYAIIKPLINRAFNSMLRDNNDQIAELKATLKSVNETCLRLRTKVK